MARDLLTTSEAAAELGIDRRTLAGYARDGILRPTLRLPSGHLRWRMEDIHRQLAELRERGGEDE